MSDDACEDFALPHTHNARDIDFQPHEYVDPACTHRRHDVCEGGCRFCASACLCVCHTWRVSMPER
jgi:hypothetical protein